MIDVEAHDDTPAAPGDLEVLQRFLNLHDHPAGIEEDVPPPPEMVRGFLVRRGLLHPDAVYDGGDHSRAMSLYSALHDRLRSAEAGGHPGGGASAIEQAAAQAGLRLRFDGELPGLEATAEGTDGALGRLVALLFLAELDGGWAHMKECASSTCTAVFYDRSRNRSGRWCSMRSCGNKHKVRAWRERHGADALDA